MDLSDVDVHVWSIPLRTRFRGIDVREGVLLHRDGRWAEWSPFVEYAPAEAARWLTSAMAALVDRPVERHRDAVPVNVTVPATSPQRAAEIVAAGGCRTAKVKVGEPGQSLSDDEARVAAVRDALGPAGRLRIDVNGGWTVEQARRAIRVLAAYDLEYVEQPCATLPELASLRRVVDVPLAADESVRKAADPLRVAGLAAADLVVLKVQPLGGVRRALQVAEACGLPVVVSSAIETSVGIATGVKLAAALPELPYACGLATVQLLTGDLVTDRLLPTDGVLPLRWPDVNRDALAHHAAAPDRTRWWLTRLAAVARQLPPVGSTNG